MNLIIQGYAYATIDPVPLGFQVDLTDPEVYFALETQEDYIKVKYSSTGHEEESEVHLFDRSSIRYSLEGGRPKMPLLDKDMKRMLDDQKQADIDSATESARETMQNWDEQLMNRSFDAPEATGEFVKGTTMRFAPTPSYRLAVENIQSIDDVKAVFERLNMSIREDARHLFPAHLIGEKLQ